MHLLAWIEELVAVVAVVETSVREGLTNTSLRLQLSGPCRGGC